MRRGPPKRVPGRRWSSLLRSGTLVVLLVGSSASLAFLFAVPSGSEPAAASAAAPLPVDRHVVTLSTRPPQAATADAAAAAPQSITPEADEAMVALCRVRRAGRAVDGCGFATSAGVVTALPEGDGCYRLRFEEGLRPPVPVTLRTPTGTTRELVVRSPDELVEVELAAGARVLGTVYDGERRPVVHASVHVGRCVARTNWSGQFRLEEVAPGGHDQVLVEHDGVLTPLAVTFDVDPGEELEGLELVLDADASLETRVLLDGAPVGDARVNVCPADLTSCALAERTTDAAGCVRFEGLPDGEYWVWASGAAIEPVFAERVRVPPNGPLVLYARAAEQHWLRGCVVDSNGAPVAGAVVSYGDGASPARTRSDAEGRFALAALRAAAPRSRVVSPEPFPPLVTVARGGRGTFGTLTRSFRVQFDSDVTLTVDEPTTWRGTLVGAPGAPVGAFDLFVSTPDGGVYVGNFAATDAVGRREFVWRDAPRSAARATLRLRDGRTLAFDVAAHDAQSLSLGELVLPEAGRVVLRPRGAAAGARTAYVEWLDPDSLEARGGTWARRTTRGTIETGDVVPAGAWRFVVHVEGLAPLDCSRHLVAATVPCEVEVAPAARRDVTVLVVSASTAVGGAHVRLDLPDATDLELLARRRTALFQGRELGGAGLDLECRTDGLGHATFARVPLGRALARVTAGDRELELAVTVEPFGSLVLDIGDGP